MAPRKPRVGHASSTPARLLASCGPDIAAVVVQSSSHVWLFVILWAAACQASLFLTISQSLPKLMFIASVRPSILWCPLLLLPSIFPRAFSNESSVCIRWPKYWNFSFSISPSSEYSGLISLINGLKEDGPEELALRSEKGQRKEPKDGGNHEAYGWAPSSTLWPEPRLLSTGSGGLNFSIRTRKWALLWHRCGARGPEEQMCLGRALGFASFISRLEVSYKLLMSQTSSDSLLVPLCSPPGSLGWNQSSYSICENKNHIEQDIVNQTRKLW